MKPPKLDQLALTSAFVGLLAVTIPILSLLFSFTGLYCGIKTRATFGGKAAIVLSSIMLLTVIGALLQTG